MRLGKLPAEQLGAYKEDALIINHRRLFGLVTGLWWLMFNASASERLARVRQFIGQGVGAGLLRVPLSVHERWSDIVFDAKTQRATANACIICVSTFAQ